MAPGSQLLPVPKNDAELERLLAELRDSPVGLEGISTELLHYILNVCLQDPKKAGHYHWFCDTARPLVKEAATFAIRIFAYNASKQVESLRERMATVLDECCDCMYGFQVQKWSSRETYLGCFEKGLLDNFFYHIDQWEVGFVLAQLRMLGMPSTTHGKMTLVSLSQPIVYHCVVNPALLANQDIWSMLATFCPSPVISQWSSRPMPPGLFLLLAHPNEHMRTWAADQLRICTSLTEDHLAKCKDYKLVLDSFACAALPQHELNAGARRKPTTWESLLAADDSALWSAFSTLLDNYPASALNSQVTAHNRTYHAVIGHLNDGGAHYESVLDAFTTLLTRLSSDLWTREGQEYAQVVFSSIKDNPAFVQLIRASDPSGEARIFRWLEPFVMSLWDQYGFADVVALVVSFMCEELQHERFKRWHPMIIGVLSKTVLAVMTKSSESKDSTHFKAVRAPFDIHAKTIVNVALASTPSETWTNAIDAARSLLDHVLRADVRDIDSKAHLLTKLVTKVPDISTLPALAFSKPLWELVFRELRGKGATAMAFIIPIIAHSAMYDQLRSQSYTAPKTSSLRSAFSTMRTSVNGALEYIHKEFEGVVELFVESSTPRTLEVMLNQHTIVEPMLRLLFSPSARLQNAGKTIVSQAYGVDGRNDCLRALMEKSPEASLKALTRINESFSGLATNLTEACSLAKSLVIYLTDVLDILCARPGGLLFAKQFIFPSETRRPTKQIGKLWSSMCKALAVVFSKTPLWSTFYENQEMTVWMRDALIYGQDLLKCRSTLESSILAAESKDGTMSSPRKLSDAGRKMVEDLQLVLTEVVNWLRLTDFELLYQSLNLLRAIFDCFRATNSKPAAEPLKKLGRFLEKARQRGNQGDDTTRLSTVDLASLQEDMDSFNDAVEVDDSDDEVQIIEPPPRPIFPSKAEASRSKKRPASPPDEPPVRKQVKTAVRVSLPSKPSPPEPKLQKPATKKVHSASSKIVPPMRVTATSRVAPPAKQPIGTAPPRPAPPPPVDEPFSINGIRNEGRPKAAKPEKPPVDSDDESEEDNAALDGLAKIQKSPRRERRQVKMLDVPLNGAGRSWLSRPALRDRTNGMDNARRISERLKPDLTPLHRFILSWDFDHAAVDPPWKGAAPSLLPVPADFTEQEQYRRVFEPLLLHECWNQLLKAKEESDNVTVTCSLAGKAYVDEWIDLDVSVTDTLPSKWFLAETDIVLLRYEADAKKKTLAKVQSSTMAFNSGRELKATLRLAASGDPGMQVGSNWRISKVYSLSTIHREYASLAALPYYDLYEDIMRARPARMPSFEENDVRLAMKNHKVNEPQAKAILASKETNGFLLVQGPPGTGKTWTICGIVGAFLVNRPKPATAVYAGRTAPPPTNPHPKKILICAPSNAGIDEVAKRLCDGVLVSTGQRVVPNVVRVGIDSSVNASVKHLTLDFLVDQKLAGPGGVGVKNEPQVDTNALRAELAAVKLVLEQKYTESSTIQGRGGDIKAIQNEITALKQKRFGISQKLDNARDKQKSDNRALDAARRKFRREVLLEADVICSTLAGAGHDTLEQFEFETVVIDEAAQSIELSSLIPLRYGCKRCVMVGDPQQLPPTVISPVAMQYKYNQSLFVRMFDRMPKAAHLLSIQYRMHPDISRIPSQMFYGGSLKDGPDMAEKTKQPWHASQLLGTYRFFNVSQGNQEGARAGHSLLNRAEVEAALALYEVFLRDFRDQDMSQRVGVISMYKAQIGALKRAFEARYGATIIGKVDFNTVDGFQGQEKDVIILSCVRAGPGVTSVGFLSDVRRLNVSITRARSSLFILGHAATLERSDDTWRHIVGDARARSVLINVDASTFRNAKLIRPAAPVPQVTSSAPPAGLMTPQNMLAKQSPSSVNGDGHARIPSAKREADEELKGAQPPAKRARTNAPVSDKPVAGSSTKIDSSGPHANGVRLNGPQGQSTGQGPTVPPPRPVPKPRPKKLAAASMFIPKKKQAPG